MPELPEVESIRRSLKIIEGKTVTKVYLSALAPVESTTPARLRNMLFGMKIVELKRHGKYLRICNPAGHSLVIHLGMSGHLRFSAQAKQTNAKHTHLLLSFEDTSTLSYCDPRRFGTLSLSQDPEGLDNPFLKRLGPDYLDPKLNEEIFLKRCRRHPGITLKTLTLNQAIATGLGNIYACETLYLAGLSPTRLVKQCKDQDLINLLHAAYKVLKLGIQHGGSSLKDYFDGLGNRGIMKNFLQVYDREGLPTLDGRGIVKRIVQHGRSTWFCPKIQK